MRSLVRLFAVCCILVATAHPAARGQDAGPRAFRSLAELESQYQKLADELDRRKLLDIAELAGRATGEEAETAYRTAFDLAVARGFYGAAEPAARAYLSRREGSPQSHALAAAISLIAMADRGEYDRSLASLESFIKGRVAAQIPEDQRLPPALLFAVGEAYLQRLIQGGRYDIARKACRLAVANRTDPAIKTYFERREARLGLVGQPAPGIEGKDVDGRPVRLADLKGKVVLVDFWATWCPPCVASFPALRQLSREYRDRGFAILGVNLDDLARLEADRPDAKAPPATEDELRWFLVAQRAGWPNLVGPGAVAAAKAYGVEEIPAGFLIDRDGKIIHVELRDQALSRTLAQLLGEPRPSR